MTRLIAFRLTEFAMRGEEDKEEVEEESVDDDQEMRKFIKSIGGALYECKCGWNWQSNEEDECYGELAIKHYSMMTRS